MILGTSRAVRVFAYPAPVDLRKGYDGLFGLVKNGLARDPLSGELFLFVNKSRKLCKVLVWDGTGLCIFQKRLEQRPLREAVARRRPGRAPDAERARAVHRGLRRSSAGARCRRSRSSGKGLVSDRARGSTTEA